MRRELKSALLLGLAFALVLEVMLVPALLVWPEFALLLEEGGHFAQMIAGVSPVMNDIVTAVAGGSGEVQRRLFPLVLRVDGQEREERGQRTEGIRRRRVVQRAASGVVGEVPVVVALHLVADGIRAGGRGRSGGGRTGQ